MTCKWYKTLHHPKIHSHTKFGIPISNNKRDMLLTHFIIKTRSEVKVTVTCKWYKTLNHPKMHSYTKFGIPFSNNIRDMLMTQLLLKLGQRSRSSGQKIICEIPPSQDAYTHQIWNSYLKEYKRYAPNTKILKIRSEVKVTVTRNGMCDTPSSQDAFRHQIWNSYLIEYRRYAPDSMQFLEIRSEVKFKVTVT